jgi:hypothetical protein
LQLAYFRCGRRPRQRLLCDNEACNQLGINCPSWCATGGFRRTL